MKVQIIACLLLAFVLALVHSASVYPTLGRKFRPSLTHFKRIVVGRPVVARVAAAPRIYGGAPIAPVAFVPRPVFFGK